MSRTYDVYKMAKTDRILGTNAGQSLRSTLMRYKIFSPRGSYSSMLSHDSSRSVKTQQKRTTATCALHSHHVATVECDLATRHRSLRKNPRTHVAGSTLHLDTVCMSEAQKITRRGTSLYQQLSIKLLLLVALFAFQNRTYFGSAEKLVVVHPVSAACFIPRKTGLKYWIHDDGLLKSILPRYYACVSAGVVDPRENCVSVNLSYANWALVDVPRVFDSKSFLSEFANKRFAFLGDSLTRNQVQSLVCLLSDTFYFRTSTPYGNKFTWPLFNFSLDEVRTRYLVSSDNPEVFNSSLIDVTVPGPHISYVAQHDILVLASFQFWHESEMGAAHSAYRTVAQTLDKVKKKDGVVLWRTMSPNHFLASPTEQGRGSCNRTLPSDISSYKHSFCEVNPNVETRNENMKAAVSEFPGQFIWDVTSYSYQRPDAHPVDLRNMDCLHWCLPGVPDWWNLDMWDVLSGITR